MTWKPQKPKTNTRTDGRKAKCRSSPAWKSKTESSRNCTATGCERSGSLRMGKEVEKVRQRKFATQQSQRTSIQPVAKTEKQVAQEDVSRSGGGRIWKRTMDVEACPSDDRNRIWCSLPCELHQSPTPWSGLEGSKAGNSGHRARRGINSFLAEPILEPDKKSAAARRTSSRCPYGRDHFRGWIWNFFYWNGQ